MCSRKLVLGLAILLFVSGLFAKATCLGPRSCSPTRPASFEMIAKESASPVPKYISQPLTLRTAAKQRCTGMASAEHVSTIASYIAHLIQTPLESCLASTASCWILCIMVLCASSVAKYLYCSEGACNPGLELQAGIHCCGKMRRTVPQNQFPPWETQGKSMLT
jgi:hypothetical protein